MATTLGGLVSVLFILQVFAVEEYEYGTWRHSPGWWYPRTSCCSVPSTPFCPYRNTCCAPMSRYPESYHYPDGYHACSCSYPYARTTTCTTVPHSAPLCAKTTTCTTVPHPVCGKTTTCTTVPHAAPCYGKTTACTTVPHFAPHLDHCYSKTSCATFHTPCGPKTTCCTTLPSYVPYPSGHYPYGHAHCGCCSCC